MGGTFMSMPEDYRNKFVAQLHNALSGFTGLNVDEAVRFVLFRFSMQRYFFCSKVNVMNTGTLKGVKQKPLELLSKRDLITA